MRWEELSWPEMAGVNKRTPVVIPLGSCEQHGHHLPLFVDTIQVTEIARRAEAALKDRVLVLPTLWLGSSHHHKDFPGTVSVKPSEYATIIKSVAVSILGAGFTRLFFLNGHGGNRVPAGNALSELVVEDDRADAACLALASWWEVGGKAVEATRKSAEMKTEFISHACEYETSLMLMIRPDLVRMDRAPKRAAPVLKSPWHVSDETLSQRIGVYSRFHRLTVPGSLGDPAAATAAKGKALLEAISDEVIAFLRDFATWKDLPAIGPAKARRTRLAPGIARARGKPRR